MERQSFERIIVAVLVGLLVFSSYALLSDSQPTGALAQTTYGDIMQYEWPILGSDSFNSRFNPGPAPDQPDLLWQSKYGAIYTVFNGMAFSVTGGKLYAVDAFTGELKWSTTLTHGGSNPNKIDDTYLFVDSTRGVAVYRISDGAYVSHLNVTGGPIVGWNNPGGGSYYPGKYSQEMKMKYRVTFNTATNESAVIAISLADPLNPELAWTYITPWTSEVQTTGEGKVFVGSYSGYNMYALDGMTGNFLWKAPKKGIGGYTAMYYNGAVYQAGGTTRITAWNATNGDILWDYDAGVSNWFPHGISAAYGRVYQHVIVHSGRPQGVPTGYYGCWDSTTGELLWKTETNYLGGYWTPAVADGKVFAMKKDRANWGGEGSANPLGYSWAAYDAYTGSILYEVPGSVSNFIVAYGNLYAGTDVIGPSAIKDWSYWRGNTEQPGVAVGQSAPKQLNPQWTFETGAAITSSPAIVDGKAYFGSYDQNWYCVDAYTGSLVWKFPTGFEASSCPAVYGGKMYTGADDGYVYCINAATGAEVWKADIYASNVPKVQFEIDTSQVRSSPIVIGDKLYVGALNGKVYCLSTANGQVLWSYQTGGPIGGSPAYANGVIYIASSDRNLYALDATSAALKWIWTTPKTATGSRQMFFVGTPIVVEDRLFIGAGGRSVKPAGPLYVCLNANTGALLWQVVTDPQGNSNNPYALTYFKGVLYGEAHMSAVAFNASNGDELWQTWIGHQVYSSAAYAEDVSGAKVYYGANSYSITCFNASNGVPLSWYTTDAQVYSSPAIYDGRVYVGSADGKFYCFDDPTVVGMDIWAESSKGAEMWPGETMQVGGQLLGTTTGKVWFDVETEVPVDSSIRPGIPNAEVILSITKPDMTSENVTTTTDNHGRFTLSYSPNIVGDWGWVAFYEGEAKSSSLTYSAAYTEYRTFKVVTPPGQAEPSPELTQTPSPTGSTNPQITATPIQSAAAFPMEYFAIIGVIVIAIVVVIAYLYTKGKKATQ